MLGTRTEHGFEIYVAMGDNGEFITPIPSVPSDPNHQVWNSSTYFVTGGARAKNAKNSERIWGAGDGGWPVVYSGKYLVVFTEPTIYFCATPTDKTRYFTRVKHVLNNGQTLTVTTNTAKQTVLSLNETVDVGGNDVVMCSIFPIAENSSDVIVTASVDGSMVVVLTDISKTQAETEASDYITGGGLVP